ncbi:MAG: transporter [Clostridia bacterium]|jgi:drug/metabolite transporter (DMT)-like permease|nr:transporter [Clostridia bacterium]MDF2889972.1 transporter [Clostridia bacterium]
MRNIALILTSIIMGAVGQILLKVGANRLGSINFNIEGLLSIIKNYYIIIGLVLFGTSFLLWVKILTKNDLSYVYPMVSISYIIIILASRFLFNEPFTINKIIGIIAIICGVFIINK